MAEIELGIYARCCRLCLSDKKEILKPIFEDTETNGVLRDRILASLSVEIKKDDRLSTMVCDPCMIKINDWSEFKQSCFKNQSTLEGWANRMQDIQNMSIQVKEEVVDHDVPLEDDDLEIVKSNLRIKTENPNFDSSEEHINGDEAEELQILKCQICNAEFDDKMQYDVHEKTAHLSDLRENGDVSIRSSTEKNISEKIEFAAGLKLIQSDSTPITMESLSKIELSYIEKCKAMVCMYRTLICACHNVSHPNLKGLLSHLRALRIWFPVFTCYHCMITFTDRSSSGKHLHKCPNTDLDTLVKLSNLRKRSGLKTRLYQNYKCVKCRFMFSFHEDFCKHVDEEHCEGNSPYYCSCQKIFDKLEDFKDHIYVSCMVEYYCDICFISVRTLDEFVNHAERNHDHSEGFVLLQEDNYKKRSFTRVEPRENKEILGKRRSSTYGKAPPVLKAEVMDCENNSDYESPQQTAKGISSKCPQCDKVYSCHGSMIRHFRTHMENNDDTQITVNGSNLPAEDALYRCPDCQVMYNSKDWELHKESHEQTKCTECNKVFLFKTEYEQHRSVHLNLKVYRDAKTHSYKSTMLSPNSESPVCDICNIVCENFEDLESHKLSHEDLEGDYDDENDANDMMMITDAASAKYSCIPCNKHYTGYSGLWEHNKKKHSDKQTTPHTYPRQCDECDKVISSGSAFASHKAMHRRVRDDTARITNIASSNIPKKSRKSGAQDDEDYFTCKRCFKVFSSKYNLKMHMKLHGINMTTSTKTPKSSKKFSCDVCNIIFPNSDALKIHRDEEHDDMPDLVSVIEEFNNRPYIFTCDICVQTFTTKNALKQHKEQHAVEGNPSKQHNKVAAYCKYCKVPFETIDALDEHMAMEHEEIPKNTPKTSKQTNNKPYSCKICRKTFVSQPAMYAHQGWHKRAKTDAMNKSQPSQKNPTAASSVKQRGAEYICNSCNQELPNDTALQIHILEKHGNVKALLTPRCEPCSQEFATQTEYENHKKLHEIVEKQKKNLTSFPCQYCSASFSKNETLQNHLRLNHREFVQEFKCPHCGRMFDKMAAYTNHIKVHEKQKIVAGPAKPLYFCSICNMGFSLPKDLRTHTISAHPF